MSSLLLSMLLILPAQPPAKGEPKGPAKPQKPSPLGSMRARSIGPALTSGRISGIAVHPENRSKYFVAVASGGVWKTENAGTTWTPVFDNEGSYSIGYVTLDPKNPNVVWVGTGENNSQRSVGYGDGVYRSIDGGRSWQNTGLKESEHIGKILIDPRNSDTVYVAAQGPLWGPGGDRGLYKTTDGGKNWTKILNISENTGVTDVVQDPRNPDIMIAASYQRRRHVWTLVNGGPESALHRTTDGGKTWNKIRAGLPSVDLGRIGLAMAPSDPDVIYAIVEAATRQGGIFCSTDRGVTWEKRNSFDQQAQYYAHLVVDPVNKDRIYVMNVLIQLSNDGGRTLAALGERYKHVDSHCMWIDPKDPSYYLVGCDGGVYESFDRAANWHFKSNLPVTQFYDVTCDEAAPFYHVYGGTQDNNTLGGPARTRYAHGIANQNWFIVLGGDGFQCRVDPKDPNIVYAEYQYAGLVRFDRRTGQRVFIQPQTGRGEPPLRWNWDSALIISPHLNTRLYFAANRVFRSDDRGDSWRPISGDLTRQLDRDRLEVFGKIQPVDAVAKHLSTSFYGNIVALAESPLKEGLIYAGTDDGLIQVTEDGGKSWTKIDKFPGVPDRSYVSKITASQHDPNTVYASFDNHKMADFKPYLLKSTDAGKTWTSLAADLPPRGTVYCVAEDHVDPKLLFCGTEFALYVSNDGGQKWVRIRAGLPTIQVKDLAIQKQMNDLVVGTFGRGIYILDDYAPLRHMKPEVLSGHTALLPIRDALLYIPASPIGGGGKGFQGESFFTSENPTYGATFTYYLKDSIKSKRQQRKDAEREAARKGAPPPLPSKDELRAEEEEEAPAIVATVTDSDGRVIRTLSGSTSEGINRITWDLRTDAAVVPRATTATAGRRRRFGPSGDLVMPGKYKVALAKRVAGVLTPLTSPVEFNVVIEGASRVPEGDLQALAAFQKQTFALQRAVNGVSATADDLGSRLDMIRRALDQTPAATEKSKQQIRALTQRHRDLMRKLRGDQIIAARNENVPTSISDRVGFITSVSRGMLQKPTGTQREQYQIVSDEFAALLRELRQMIEVDLRALDKELDVAGAPWTPGRLPEWPVK